MDSETYEETMKKIREYAAHGLILGPINWGTWDKDGKFHGSTNYSGEASRAVLTIEPEEKVDYEQHRKDRSDC